MNYSEWTIEELSNTLESDNINNTQKLLICQAILVKTLSNESNLMFISKNNLTVYGKILLEQIKNMEINNE